MSIAKPPRDKNAAPEITFDVHRRQGAFFSYAFVTHADGSREQLGDPWPASRWPAKVVMPLARSYVALRKGNKEAADRYLAESIEQQRAIIDARESRRA